MFAQFELLSNKYIVSFTFVSACVRSNVDRFELLDKFYVALIKL